MRKPSANGKPASFDDDLERLRGFGKDNKESLGELLFHFFRRYAYDLDYEKNVVSVREAKLISKEGKKWHLMQNNRLCVEEPFNTERNLGNTADDTSFRGIHLELRRAFDLVKDAKLDECLEKYIFPATEEKIFEKPASKPPPVLTRSRSQSQSSRGNRGGYGGRGASRQGFNNQRTSGRRSSSAAAFNKVTIPQMSLQGMPGRDHFLREYHLQAQYESPLHNELSNQMELLRAQEQELRSRMLAKQQHPMAREPNRMPLVNQIPLTDPMRNGQYFYPFQYPQVPGTPHQSVHTQPSSPSMKPVHPDLRRSVHRSSVADNSSANNRSHSQPARPLPPNPAGQNVPPVPTNNPAFLQHQHQLRHQQLYSALDIAQGRPKPVDMPVYHQDPRRILIDQPFEESVPKEYVGYWINDSPPQQGYRGDHLIQRLPAYNDLHPRVRGVPPNLSRLRDTSRSPSPSPAMPFRDRSFSIRSASSAPPQPAQSRYERVQPSIVAPQNPATAMLNGTHGWIIPDYSMIPDASSHATTRSEATSSSDDRQYETPVTVETDVPSGQGVDGDLPLEDPNRYFHTQEAPWGSRTPSGNQKGNVDFMPRHPFSSGAEIPVSPSSTYRQEKPGPAAGGLGIQFGEHEVRKPSVKAEHTVSPKSARSVTTIPVPEPRSEQKPPVALPLLSPVREVRSPSPNTKRKEDLHPQVQRSFRRADGKLDLYIPPFAELVRAKQEKQVDASAKTPNGVPSTHLSESSTRNQSSQGASASQPPQGSKTSRTQDESSKGTMPHPQVNGWQQQSSKKGKKNKSRPSSGNIPGKQMPVNEADRKGG